MYYRVPMAGNGDSCVLSCYDTKSEAYQTCKKIPPSDTKTRMACFQQADKDVKDCLAICKPTASADVTAGTAVIAAGVVTTALFLMG